MVIREMSRTECLHVLAGSRLARLGCAQENQPYVVPVCLAYDEASECLYGFTTLGQKIEWMRVNPLVCVEVDEVTADDQWVSVIAFGRYEELPETTGSDDARLQAPKRPRPVGEATHPWSVESSHRPCDDERRDDEREHAWQVFQSHPMWWEPSLTAWAARTHRDSAEPFIPVYYKIRIDRVTGHEATPNAKDAISGAALPSPAGRWGRLCKMLARVFGGRSKEAGSTS
jgi:nitroimidazol reductase NimA-like FMN-containing flavoprotein (pyridoxamine 5'-phosphate oxidase superfamily)